MPKKKIRDCLTFYICTLQSDEIESIESIGQFLKSENVSIQDIRDNNSKLNAVTIKVKIVYLQEKNLLFGLC